MTQMDTILITKSNTEGALSKVRQDFKNVHYYPDDKPIPSEILSQAEMIFTGGGKLSTSIKSLKDLPNLRHIQMGSAGANGILGSEQMKEYLKDKKEGGREITLAGASGTHVLSIPNYVVAMVITLYHQLQTQIILARTKAKWFEGHEIDHSGEGIYARKTQGRTVGLLGYGALGRETARLLKAHGMRVIAANTSGKRTTDEGYIIPGTGDKDGSIPEEFYSTKDSKSLEAFLKETDVLVASLPGTPQTQYLLDAEKLALLKPNALFINVGRGSLIRSEHILKALDAPNGLFGAALDVTDPEPLPDNHPLFTHPKCIVTPHLSGDTEGEFDIAMDIAIENANRIRKGEKVVNLIDPERGY